MLGDDRGQAVDRWGSTAFLVVWRVGAVEI